MSDTDDSFNFLISMAYTQLFNLLCEKADDVYGGRLPVHVRCLIDDQLQLVIGRDLPQLRNVKGGQPCAAAHKDRFSCFARTELKFLVLAHSKVIRGLFLQLKGTLIIETGKMLQRCGYRIKVLNTINFKKSMKYNPFA